MKLGYERGDVRVYEKPDSNDVILVHAQRKTHRVLAYADEFDLPSVGIHYTQAARELVLHDIAEVEGEPLGEVDFKTSEADGVRTPGDRPMVWVYATAAFWPPAPEDGE